MKVLNDLLDFEGLQLYQRTDMFNFSLDSVLLARFARLNSRTKKIIDIGTNNAVIPLILSCYTNAQITGVEIQGAAAQLAQDNVHLNKKSSQITIIHDDIKHYAQVNARNKFDLVICNPPFFKVGESKLNEKSELLIPARHEVHLTLPEIISAAQKITENRGYLVLVHRATRLDEVLNLLTTNDFAVKRIKFIHPFRDSEANNFLIEARFKGAPGVIIEPPFIVHNEDGSYTEEIKAMFRK
ncbi:hypothetical protein P344_00065 [Spiroplasma mirum ATCC 29335]|uniref:Methyltransferase small domain-containing protein n=1 Tax=Spiroplasma mirum ATCC 29335 TaxID=838561 RepID=W0GPF1_9MOLU|nr:MULTISPECIES: tRNA1(Val) (adenine(37)-N6)-methyltransferase [Spiroplasma]AHF60494.1 putative methyltransferase [Spiroplasma mirum ATCC 29335]AHI57392.1 hypothetical protein P344_00065 [Spiroplasma mirum ATCC 29335]AKM52622.1 methyltransferase [Spiroplasma atrichopogonis]